jgi:thioredoxin type arsenate reductase
VNVLFVCSGNRARSQLAEGWARKLAPAGVEIWSAGTRPHPDGVHPMAVAVMKEKGVDIGRQYSKSLSHVPLDADYVITLCSEADAECPTLAARVARLAWHLPDPGIAGTDEQALWHLFREIRDEIERRLREFFSGPPFRKPGQVWQKGGNDGGTL